MTEQEILEKATRLVSIGNRIFTNIYHRIRYQEPPTEKDFEDFLKEWHIISIELSNENDKRKKNDSRK